MEELQIPKPDYNLGIFGGSHGKMTGEMLIAIEQVFFVEKPDTVLLYGDTNSICAGVLTASKLNIPSIHVEVCGILATINNPEEVNRIVTDHLHFYLRALPLLWNMLKMKHYLNAHI